MLTVRKAAVVAQNAWRARAARRRMLAARKAAVVVLKAWQAMAERQRVRAAEKIPKYGSIFDFDESDARVCSRCGQQLKPGWFRCGKCSTRVTIEVLPAASCAAPAEAHKGALRPASATQVQLSISSNAIRNPSLKRIEVPPIGAAGG